MNGRGFYPDVVTMWSLTRCLRLWSVALGWSAGLAVAGIGPSDRVVGPGRRTGSPDRVAGSGRRTMHFAANPSPRIRPGQISIHRMLMWPPQRAQRPLCHVLQVGSGRRAPLRARKPTDCVPQRASAHRQPDLGELGSGLRGDSDDVPAGRVIPGAVAPGRRRRGAGGLGGLTQRLGAAAGLGGVVSRRVAG